MSLACFYQITPFASLLGLKITLPRQKLWKTYPCRQHTPSTQTISSLASSPGRRVGNTMGLPGGLHGIYTPGGGGLKWRLWRPKMTNSEYILFMMWGFSRGSQQSHAPGDGVFVGLETQIWKSSHIPMGGGGGGFTPTYALCILYSHHDQIYSYGSLCWISCNNCTLPNWNGHYLEIS